MLRFIEDVNQLEEIFFLSLKLEMVVRNSTPGEFAYIWKSKRVGIIAMMIYNREFNC